MREFLEHAAKKYYEGDPIISDEQFDVLVDVYKFNDVGYKITDGVPHIYRMYSLQKFSAFSSSLSPWPWASAWTSSAPAKQPQSEG